MKFKVILSFGIFLFCFALLMVIPNLFQTNSPVTGFATGIPANAINVTACGTLSVNGGYYILQNNLSSNGGCLSVGNHNIILDGNGFYLKHVNNPNSSIGITVFNRNNVTIQNINVRNYTYGVWIELTNNSMFSNITSGGNFLTGFLFLTGKYNHLEDSYFFDNPGQTGGDGGVTISSAQHTVIRNISSNNNANGISVLGFNTTILDSIVSSNIYSGILLLSTQNNSIQSISSFNNSINGVNLYGSSYNTLDSVLTYNNRGVGLLIDGSSNVVISNLSSYGNFGGDFNLTNGGLFNSIKDYSLVNSYSFSNGSVYLIEQSPFGKINFLSWINVIGTNFSRDITFANSFVDIRTDLVLGFNVSANVTFYNVPTNFTNVTLLRNGVTCPVTICINITSLNSSTVVFNVTGWSNYSIIDSGVIQISTPPPPSNLQASSGGGGGGGGGTGGVISGSVIASINTTNVTNSTNSSSSEVVTQLPNETSLIIKDSNSTINVNSIAGLVIDGKESNFKGLSLLGIYILIVVLGISVFLVIRRKFSKK